MAPGQPHAESPHIFVPTNSNPVTIYAILSFDNDLRKHGKDDLEEIKLGTSKNPVVQVAVLYDSIYRKGDKYLVIENGQITASNQLGQISTNDESTLDNFFKWAYSQTNKHPDIFVIGGHGDGYCIGLDSNVTNKNPYAGFTPLQVYNAIRKLPVRPHTALLDACLSADTFLFRTLSLAGFEAFTGSPNSIPGSGCRYDLFLERLKPGMTPSEIAALFLDSYEQWRLTEHSEETVLVAYNRNIANIVPLLIEISTQMEKGELAADIRKFRYQPDTSFADIWQFSRLPIKNIEDYCYNMYKVIESAYIRTRNLRYDAKNLAVGLNCWLPRKHTSIKDINQISRIKMLPHDWSRMLLEVNEKQKVVP